MEDNTKEMGNIVNDIVEDIEIKPKNSKRIIKWVVSISLTLIGVAFALGQFKASFFNRMDEFEEALNKNTAAIEQMPIDVDAKIDKVYDDGLKIFNDFQEYNAKQLGMIIDYGSENKEMLKDMLELQNMERTRNLENQVEQAKNESDFSGYVGQGEAIAIEEENGRDFSISAVPMKDKPFMVEVFFIEVESQDTTFNISGATQDYVNSIDRNQYEVGAVIASDKYPNRYDFSYRRKR